MDSVPDAYIAAVNKVQTEAYKRILPLLESLQLDPVTKQVLANAENYAISAQINQQMDAILIQSGMRTAITDFTSSLAEQRALTDTLYRTLLDDPRLSFAEFDAVWAASRAEAIGTVSTGAVGVFRDQVAGALNNSIGSSSTFSQTVSSIRNTVTGNAEVDGALSRYANLYAKDSFAITNRKYAEQVNKAYGIEFYRYSGGNKDTTREFCLERAGHYFHKKEIESWAGKQWAGKKRGTDTNTIFTFLGGWNCNHFLAPVPVDKVPVEVLENAIKKGWVKESELPKRVRGKLGLEV
jgi:hypothetical protein